MVKSGMGSGSEAEAAVTRLLKTDQFTITINLNSGRESAKVLTCDLSVDYVRINADYRS